MLRILLIAYLAAPSCLAVIDPSLEALISRASDDFASVPIGMSGQEPPRPIGHLTPSGARYSAITYYLGDLPERIDLIRVVPRRFSVEGTDYLILDLQIFQIFAF